MRRGRAGRAPARGAEERGGGGGRRSGGRREEGGARAPARGCAGPNSLRAAIRPGISCSAMSSSLRPKSASDMSATLKSPEASTFLGMVVGEWLSAREGEGGVRGWGLGGGPWSVREKASARVWRGAEVRGGVGWSCKSSRPSREAARARVARCWAGGGRGAQGSHSSRRLCESGTSTCGAWRSKNFVANICPDAPKCHLLILVFSAFF